MHKILFSTLLTTILALPAMGTEQFIQENGGFRLNPACLSDPRIKKVEKTQAPVVLPESINGPIRVQSIALIHAGIDRLPEYLLNFDSRIQRNLNLENNNIAELPAALLRGEMNLTSLSLKSNRINYINLPINLIQTVVKHKIDLDNNPIAFFPPQCFPNGHMNFYTGHNRVNGLVLDQFGAKAHFEIYAATVMAEQLQLDFINYLNVVFKTFYYDTIKDLINSLPMPIAEEVLPEYLPNMTFRGLEVVHERNKVSFIRSNSIIMAELLQDVYGQHPALREIAAPYLEHFRPFYRH